MSNSSKVLFICLFYSAIDVTILRTDISISSNKPAGLDFYYTANPFPVITTGISLCDLSVRKSTVLALYGIVVNLVIT